MRYPIEIQLSVQQGQQGVCDRISSEQFHLTGEQGRGVRVADSLFWHWRWKDARFSPSLNFQKWNALFVNYYLTGVLIQYFNFFSKHFWKYITYLVKWKKKWNFILSKHLFFIFQCKRSFWKRFFFLKNWISLNAKDLHWSLLIDSGKKKKKKPTLKIKA